MEKRGKVQLRLWLLNPSVVVTSARGCNIRLFLLNSTVGRIPWVFVADFV